jgi:hypothetical protein
MGRRRGAPIAKYLNESTNLADYALPSRKLSIELSAEKTGSQQTSIKVSIGGQKKHNRSFVHACSCAVACDGYIKTGDFPVAY